MPYILNKIRKSKAPQFRNSENPQSRRPSPGCPTPAVRLDDELISWSVGPASAPCHYRSSCPPRLLAGSKPPTCFMYHMTTKTRILCKNPKHNIFLHHAIMRNSTLNPIPTKGFNFFFNVILNNVFTFRQKFSLERSPFFRKRPNIRKRFL